MSRRLVEHRNGSYSDFTWKYKVFSLVFFEEYQDIRDALTREKQMKAWRRQWKINLINRFNANWQDLSDQRAV